MAVRSGWQKSSYSGAEGPNCVEVARSAGGGLLLRESEAPEDVLVTSRAGMRGLIAAVKAGDFDRPGR
ncbi:DUF397 domain-containing protein [Streptomyces zingiberis]|uniref:DUF397 domain-containing protein n=1 Tax=Streptomyces zingiberis TaxID=2053010 RepID=A0ABX1C1S8_9ACTN|nr:DUF397 domain-containing protein [Streptomyces zingiberis]NJQ02538.1 DUF397 domain-containing protein [Streptomyces zingiberis]